MLFNRPTTRADGGNVMKRFLSDALAVFIMALGWLVLISVATIPILLLFILKNAAFN
jgi:hypothetical protein